MGTRTCCGQRTARLRGYKTWLLIAILAELVGLIAMIAYTLTRYDYPLREDEQRSGFSLTLAMLWAAVAAIDFVVEGMLFEKRMMIAFFMLGCMLLESYVIFDYFEGSLSHRTRLLRLIVASSLVPLNFIGGAMIIRDMGFFSFHVVGADAELQEKYRIASEFNSWLRLDFTIGVALVIMASIPGLLTDLQMLLTLLGLLLTILWVGMGYGFSFWEMKYLKWPFLLLAFLEPTFIVYEVYDISARDFGEGIVTYPTLLLSGLAIGIRVLIIVHFFRVDKRCEGLGDRVFGFDTLEQGLNEKRSGYNTFGDHVHDSDSD
eukprot:TRINITY_DN5366_c0_g1_i1.p1 TRINITY_DN5366_c0_g1~~TRINITY_DN5366_c0_g1_i1.p1  ORF type:complete len:318 (+),score=22.09 TRINITY_DN5366_c0_g1_i1:233-1186(+)